MAYDLNNASDRKALILEINSKPNVHTPTKLKQYLTELHKIEETQKSNRINTAALTQDISSINNILLFRSIKEDRIKPPSNDAKTADHFKHFLNRYLRAPSVNGIIILFQAGAANYTTFQEEIETLFILDLLDDTKKNYVDRFKGFINRLEPTPPDAWTNHFEDYQKIVYLMCLTLLKNTTDTELAMSSAETLIRIDNPGKSFKKIDLNTLDLLFAGTVTTKLSETDENKFHQDLKQARASLAAAILEQRYECDNDNTTKNLTLLLRKMLEKPDQIDCAALINKLIKRSRWTVLKEVIELLPKDQQEHYKAQVNAALTLWMDRPGTGIIGGLYSGKVYYRNTDAEKTLAEKNFAALVTLSGEKTKTLLCEPNSHGSSILHNIISINSDAEHTKKMLAIYLKNLPVADIFTRHKDAQGKPQNSVFEDALTHLQGDFAIEVLSTLLQAAKPTDFYHFVINNSDSMSPATTSFQPSTAISKLITENTSLNKETVLKCIFEASPLMFIFIYLKYKRGRLASTKNGNARRDEAFVALIHDAKTKQHSNETIDIQALGSFDPISSFTFYQEAASFKIGLQNFEAVWNDSDTTARQLILGKFFSWLHAITKTQTTDREFAYKILGQIQAADSKNIGASIRPRMSASDEL